MHQMDHNGSSGAQWISLSFIFGWVNIINPLKRSDVVLMMGVYMGLQPKQQRTLRGCLNAPGHGIYGFVGDDVKVMHIVCDNAQTS